jgi:hypothetical protein
MNDIFTFLLAVAFIIGVLRLLDFASNHSGVNRRNRY